MDFASWGMIERSRKAEGEKSNEDRKSVREVHMAGVQASLSTATRFVSIELHLEPDTGCQAQQSRLPDIHLVLWQLETARAERLEQSPTSNGDVAKEGVVLAAGRWDSLDP